MAKTRKKAAKKTDAQKLGELWGFALERKWVSDEPDADDNDADDDNDE